jgi:hypothetical protein
MTMWHPTDEDLVLHYYGEAPTAGAARLDAHLRDCPNCREQWTDLRETLGLVDAADVPEPGPGFERIVWARLQPALEAPPSAGGWLMRQWLPAFGLGAAVVMLVSLSLNWRLAHPETPEPAPLVQASGTERSQARERVLWDALDFHFEQTEMLLVELMNAPQTEARELEFERTAADDLVASGRLYRFTAEETGDIRLARMLEDLESVLVDVARSPETVDRDGMASLRARISDGDLLFKVRAVTNDLRGRQQNVLTVSEGPL